MAHSGDALMQTVKDYAWGVAVLQSAAEANGGRVPSKSPEAQEPISYYSRLALEAKRDERN
jgi:hypothetical protein